MPEEALERYVAFFHSLSVERLADLGTVMTDDVHFTDPFHSLEGIDAVRSVFDAMFTHLSDVRFEVTHAAMTDARTGLLHWRLTARQRGNGKPWPITGMSIVRFAVDGRVCDHVDHWDAAAQFYERLPVIGRVLAFLRHRVVGR